MPHLLQCAGGEGSGKLWAGASLFALLQLADMGRSMLKPADLHGVHFSVHVLDSKSYSQTIVRDTDLQERA